MLPTEGDKSSNLLIVSHICHMCCCFILHERRLKKAPFINIYNMNANQSKQQSDNRNNSLAKQQMRRIQQEITKAILKGLYEVMIYETVYQENFDQLQEWCYELSKMGGRMGERNLLIKWKTPCKEEPKPNGAYYPASTHPWYPL